MLVTRVRKRARAIISGVGVVGVLALAGCGGGKPADVRHHEQGKIYLEKNRDYTKAVREFEKALAVNPKRPKTMYLLGRAYLLSGRYDEALKTFNRLQDPLGKPRRADLGRSETHLARAGRRLAEAGQFKKVDEFVPVKDDLAAAEQYADACIKDKDDPKDTEAVLRLANVAMEWHRFHAAKRDLLLKRERLERDSGHRGKADALKRAAEKEAGESQKRLQDATERYEHVTTLDPRNVLAYRRIIENARLLRDLDRADTAARRLLEVQPNAGVALLALAEMAFAKWQQTEDERYLEDVRQHALTILERVSPDHERGNLLMARYGLSQAQHLARTRRETVLKEADESSTSAKRRDELLQRAKQLQDEAKKKYDVVIDHTKRVLARNPGNPPALHYQGLAYFEKQNYDMAILRLQRLANTVKTWADPKQGSSVHLYLAEAYRKTENPGEAVSELSKAVKLDPTNVGAIESLGNAYIQQGRFDAARDLKVNYADAASPASGLILEGLICEAEAREKERAGLKRASKGLEAKAKQAYDRAAQLQPDHPFVQNYRVVQLLLSGDNQRAAAEADTILAANPNNYDVRYRKALALARLGRLIEAIETCRENVARSPAHNPTHTLTADIYLRCRRPDLAIRYIRAVPKETPPHLMDRRLAVLYLNRSEGNDRNDEQRTQDLQAAIGAADRVLKNFKDAPRMSLVAAEAYRRLGEHARSEHVLNDALKKHPKDANVLHAAADAAMLGGNLTRARQLFERALAADDKYYVSTYPLGMVLLAEGKTDEAVKHFRDATRTRLRQRDYYVGLVVSLQMARNADQAAAEAARALEAIGPYYPLETAHLMTLIGANKPTEALAAIDAMDQRHKAIGRPIRSDHVRRLRDLTAMLKDDPERAREVARKANLTDFYALGGWRSRAIPEAEATLKLVPTSVDRMLALLQNLNAATPSAATRTRALEVARQIAKADASSPGAHALLAVQCQLSSQFDEAEAALKRTAELAPKEPRPLFDLGSFYERRAAKDKAHQKAYRDKAIAAYRAAAGIPDLERAPVVAFWTYNNLAYLLAVHAGDVEAASPLASKAKALAEKHARLLMRDPSRYGTVLDTIGWIEHLSGKDADALTTLERANILHPFNPTLVYHLGMVYVATGEKAKARQWLTRAIEIRDDTFEHLEDAKKAIASLDAVVAPPD